MFSFHVYDIEKEIGRGLHSVVYAAVHRFTRQRVALKLYPIGFLADLEFRHQFEQRIKLIRTLDDVSLVPILEFEVYQRQPYIVMPLLVNGSMMQRFAPGELADLKETNQILVVIAHALEMLHESGVVHGRLNPASVLFDDDLNPYLAGVCLPPEFALGGSGYAWEALGILPNYLAPEQIRGNRPVFQTDVYGLATILYQLLAGAPPYFEAEVADIVRFHTETRCAGVILRNIGNLRKPYLFLLIYMTLSPEIDKRPATIQQFVQDYFEKTKQQRPERHPMKRPWWQLFNK